MEPPRDGDARSSLATPRKLERNNRNYIEISMKCPKEQSKLHGYFDDISRGTHGISIGIP